MYEAADDVPNVLIPRMLVLLIYTYTGNSDNGVSSMIVMILFHYLKKKISATKINFEEHMAGSGARG